MSTSTPLDPASSSRFARFRDGEREFQIHYNDLGHEHARTVVMLHGSGPGATGWANFHRNLEPFVSAGYRVLLLDFPGWGESDPVVCDGGRSELNARALKGLLDAVGITGPVDLIGNSMGGHTAVAFALAHPEQVGRLVLMGGGTGGPSQGVPQPTEGIKALQQLYRAPTLDNLHRMMQLFVFDPSALTEDLLRMRMDAMLARREHLENFVRSIDLNPRQFTDFGPRLATVKAPTLIIWGRDDRFVPMDVGLRLLWNLPNADLHVFRRCGHWAQWEHADAFNRMVLDFLAA